MRKNKKFASYLIAAAFSMFALAYASVPIYNIFCKATGFGGYVKRVPISEISQQKAGSKMFVVEFDSFVSKDLPWQFTPEQRAIKVMTGKTGLGFYSVENTSNEPISGIAVYNVTPTKVAKYFSKVACFCFTKQTLAPKQKVIMPVTFVISPDIEQDPEVQEVSTITLSYNFMQYRE